MLSIRLFLGALLTCLSLQAQHYFFDSFSIKDGVHQSQISAITQGKDGWLYLGSQSGGISKFNGLDFELVFEEELSGAVIWRLITDSKGNVWAGTDMGLYRISEGNISRVKVGKEVDAEIWAIHESQDGALWVGTKDFGLYRLKDGKYTHFGINDGLGFSSVNAICEDELGVIWAGSYGYGIARVENGNATNCTKSYKFSDRFIKDMDIVGGHLMIGSESGVWRLEGNIFSRVFPLNGVANVIDFVDLNGSLYVATEDNGLYIIGEKGTTHITKSNGLNTNYLFCLYGDIQGSLWVGTDGAGFSRFGGRTFTYFNEDNGLGTNMVLCLKEDRSGNMWFGTDNGVVIRTPNGNFKYVTREQGLVDDYVYHFVEDNLGNMWVGTEAGICLIDPKNNFSVTTNDSLRSVGFTYCMLLHDNGKVRASTDAGLFEFDSGSIIPLFEGALPESPVHFVFQDSHNRTWYLMDNQIFRQDGESFLSIKNLDSTRGYFQMAEDNFGNYFIGHQFGLMVLRSDGTIEQIGIKDGLSSSNLFTVAFYQNSLWLGHQKGIDRVWFNEDGFTDSIRRYSRGDGLVGVETNEKAFTVDRKGHVWVGTVSGAYQYNAQFDENRHSPPLVSISDLKLFNGTKDWRSLYPEFNKGGRLPSNPSFHYSDDHVSFEFSGIDLQNPKEVYFQFWLKGYDKGWSPPSKDNTVSYSNLPPGDYTLIVRAGNKYDEWSEPQEYSFSIEAPFWQETWFYFVVIPLGVLIIYIILLLRTRKLSRSKRKLEEKIRQRTIALRHNNQELKRLSIVAQEIYDAVMICGPNGEIQWYNKSFYEMAGYASQLEFEQSDYGKIRYLYELSSDKSLQEQIKAFKEGAKPYKYDSFHVTKKGDKRWTAGTLTPIYNEAQVLTNIIAVFTDITDRKRFEEEIKKSNIELTRLSLVAEHMNEACLVTDAEGKVLFYNKGFVRNSGYEETNMETFFEKHPTLKDLSSNENISEIIESFKNGGSTVIYDSSHTMKDGSVMWTTASLTPVFKKGELEYIVAVYTDITDRRKLTMQLQQTNKDLTDSIKYAKQIQTAVLPSPDILESVLQDSFVYYKPRDIVSGDFYWFSIIKDVLIIAAADCTGHGVPGAFMSMIGNEFLHQIVNNRQVDAPHEALHILDSMITRALHQSDEGESNTTKDGMDIAMCAIHTNSGWCQFAGAFNPLLIVRDGEVLTFDAAKESIGGGNYRRAKKKFFTHDITLQDGDALYMFSDGYLDQFGGEKNKKFTAKRFRQLILDMDGLPMSEQRTITDTTFKEWRGENKQVDDVLVIGMRYTTKTP